MLLAEIHADAGEFEKALAYLERAVHKEPDDPTARLLLAHILTLAKHYERAVAEYELLRTRTPDDPSIRHNLGMLSVLTGRPEEAIRYFLEELALRRTRRPVFLLGMTYGKLGRFPEAIGHLERYLASLPQGETAREKKPARRFGISGRGFPDGSYFCLSMKSMIFLTVGASGDPAPVPGISSNCPSPSPSRPCSNRHTPA